MSGTCEIVSGACVRCGLKFSGVTSGRLLTGCSGGVKRTGLGDMVAAGLAAIGITKERVSAALGRPCSCPQRQEALNDLGRRIGIG